VGYLNQETRLKKIPGKKFRPVKNFLKNIFRKNRSGFFRSKVFFKIFPKPNENPGKNPLQKKVSPAYSFHSVIR